MNTRQSFGRIRLAAAVVLAGAVVAPAFASAARAHVAGSWMLGVEVQMRLESRGYNLPSCSGSGRHRFTQRSTLNPTTWLYRHFQCVAMDAGGAPKWTICVHSLPGRRITISRRTLLTSGYFPCRF